MEADGKFRKWHHRAEDEESYPVFPDGCRDVLIVSRQGRPDRIVLTEFDVRPRNVTLPRGTEIAGYRLRPGTAVSQRVLNAITEDRADVENILGNALDTSDDTGEVIVALTLPGSTVRSVAKDNGVSIRTMQRRFRDLHLPPPEYWRLLGRARRAVGMLSLPVSLAEIACDSGFSDQAHMTREFVRWFGETPTRLRRDASLLALLNQPALGTWTGEQISTR
jgi:AraC-like DNA-binding protein